MAVLICVRVAYRIACSRSKARQPCARDSLTFVNTTAISYGQNISRSRRILLACNSSCVHKRQDITSISEYCSLGGSWEIHQVILHNRFQHFNGFMRE